MSSLSDRNNAAKRRRLNDPDERAPRLSQHSDQASLDDCLAFLNETDDDDEDDGLSSELYDESQEQFPKCPAFDPAIPNIRARAESSIKKLAEVLGPYASVNENLENMRSNCDEIMKPTVKPLEVALLGATAAGKSDSNPRC